ncbi:MAG: polya polymerase [Christensenellales bacterium]|jgi:hypothetical protein
MKITNIINPGRFFEALNKTRGSVELVTDEGDRLNLKSKLCQYIALTQMFTDGKIETVEIILSEPEDLDIIAPFLKVERPSE